MQALVVLWRLMRGLLLALVAAVLFLEEWGWRPLTAWAAQVASWPPLARLEGLIKRSGPMSALLLFLAPAVLLLPVKLIALWLIAEGRPGLGIAVIVLAKLVGTALVGRLFVLLEPQLMHFVWFARALGWWRLRRVQMQAAIRRTLPWRALSALRRRWRGWVRHRAR
jgi:hypothetical protein